MTAAGPKRDPRAANSGYSGVRISPTGESAECSVDVARAEVSASSM
jgi:hypothetical protein